MFGVECSAVITSSHWLNVQEFGHRRQKQSHLNAVIYSRVKISPQGNIGSGMTLERILVRPVSGPRLNRRFIFSSVITFYQLFKIYGRNKRACSFLFVLFLLSTPFSQKHAIIITRKQTLFSRDHEWIHLRSTWNIGLVIVCAPAGLRVPRSVPQNTHQFYLPEHAATTCIMYCVRNGEMECEKKIKHWGSCQKKCGF